MGSPEKGLTLTEGSQASRHLSSWRRGPGGADRGSREESLRPGAGGAEGPWGRPLPEGVGGREPRGRTLQREEDRGDGRGSLQARE